MAGLVKAKKYNWKDSNLALFGSKLERDVKKASAETEPAWKGAGQEVGLQIWRIVKFKVTQWPKEDYGKFYSGDSYIVLNTYKKEGSEELKWDVHFWIGKYSTQDEYGTAAYKTVELDTLLDDGPVQHREVQGWESDLFKSYFQQIVIMEGGSDTGFRHVTPEQYRPRLLHFQGSKRVVEVREVPLKRKSLNSGDVFILDLGLKIYQWNGTDSNKDERFKAMALCQQLESERGGRAKADVLEEFSTSSDFYDALKDDEPDEDEDDFEDVEIDRQLFRLTDAHGSLETKLEATGADVKKDRLDPADVFIVDNGKTCFVWVGTYASKKEKAKGMVMAHDYLSKTKHPLVPVTVVKEGQDNEAFDLAFAA
ncbi:gelsolin-like protein 2 [Lingula anatina]|uniref:Actin-modulator n=1 Tax=Lingula anatina TaxID=7574 RepID=A0A1S3J8W7_LINAN|nr:gelsolin-like protein 2 [Lingula anatina]|eukprot:XP_013406840.1 gelsolin-like protein 2 [Lingula anatina]